MNIIDEKEVCIIGMGFVGLTLAIIVAEKGFRVIGVEINDRTLSELKDGKSHFHETGLKERLKKVIANKSLTFTKDLKKTKKSRIYIVTVGTPLNMKGEPSLKMVKNASREVSNVLNPEDLVILRSTVKLGTTRKIVMPILEKAKCSFKLAFCPERTIEGNALEELTLLPQICGGINDDSLTEAINFFSKISSSSIKVSSLESAEMIKLLDNSYRDLMFAFGNEVALMCESVCLNAKEIIHVGKLGYERTNIASPGLVGGPCLSKDPHILQNSLKEYNYTPSLIKTGREINEKIPEIVINKIHKYFKKLKSPKKIVICGLAFKGRPETDDLRGTPAEIVIKEIKKVFPNSEIFLQDFAASKEDLESKFNLPAIDIYKAFFKTDLLIIANNNRKYLALDLVNLIPKMNDKSLIYDFWSLLNPSDFSSKKVNYASFGLNSFLQR